MNIKYIVSIAFGDGDGQYSHGKTVRLTMCQNILEPVIAKK